MAFLNPGAALASKIFHKNVIEPKLASQSSDSTSQVAITAHEQNVASATVSVSTNTHKISKISGGMARTTISSDRH